MNLHLGSQELNRHNLNLHKVLWAAKLLRNPKVPNELKFHFQDSLKFCYLRGSSLFILLLRATKFTRFLKLGLRVAIGLSLSASITYPKEPWPSCLTTHKFPMISICTTNLDRVSCQITYWSSLYIYYLSILYFPPGSPKGITVLLFLPKKRLNPLNSYFMPFNCT